MFKTGDRVVCVNTNFSGGFLNIYENYIIVDIKNDIIKLENSTNYWYSINRFISLKESRKKKIEKLKNYE